MSLKLINEMSGRPKEKRRFWLAAIFSLAAGLMIYFIDSSSGWDDTGITVGLILISSILAGVMYSRNMWLWALMVGIWIPAVNIIKHGDIKFLIILLISFAGAYSGGLISSAMAKNRNQEIN